jgi:hypothetical protein
VGKTQFKNLTSAPVQIPEHPTDAMRPGEFVRLPKVGKTCPYSGLSRSFLNGLILPMKSNRFTPPVRSFVIRKNGSKTGVRLISWLSLKKFIEAHAENGNGKGENTR